MTTANLEAPQFQDAIFDEKVQFFMQFFDSTFAGGHYKKEILRLIETKGKRLIVGLDHLRVYNEEKYKNIKESPNEWLPPFEKALKDFVIKNSIDKTGLEDEQYYIGFEGSFGEHHLNPRTLRAAFLGKLVCVEGIVTRCSKVRPKLVKSVHWCEKTHIFYSKEYQDSTALGNLVNSTPIYPTEDDNGNPLTTLFGYSVYLDHQMISIQEMPERAPVRGMSKSLDVILDDDLADRVKPGDRIQLAGVYRTVGNPKPGHIPVSFKTLIVANNISLLLSKAGGGIVKTIVTPSDIKSIEKLKSKNGILKMLANALAPSIYGHDIIKKAIVLMLLGGREINMASGTHIRGDINILMVGDPSTAKSQILRFVLNTAPLAIATTGRGTSGVGLTAAIVSDKETGERRLEAGAMVLADRGVVCIDEFDKMNEMDRVAIHEVMEQQTVTIAKAGIHTTLNSRCSVLAAANPVYGQYNVHKPPAQNIALPDSLLSRFDLLFVVTDEISDIRDRSLAEHVLRMHRYFPSNLMAGTPISDVPPQTLYMGQKEEIEVDHVWEDYFDPADGKRRSSRSKSKKKDFIPNSLLKKYIQYAKTKSPILNEAAAAHCNKVWVELRNANSDGRNAKTLPITTRTLETLFRLATAHAKARLSDIVEEEDAQIAEEIVRFALYKEVLPDERKKKKQKKKRDDDGFDSNSEDSDDDGDNDGNDQHENNEEGIENARDEIINKRKGKRPVKEKPTRHRTINGVASGSNTKAASQVESPDFMETDETPALENEDLSEEQSRAALANDNQQGSSSSATSGFSLSANIIISVERLRLFKDNLLRVMNSSFLEGSMRLTSLLPELNRELSDAQRFTEIEAEAALSEMQEKNMIYYSEGDLRVLLSLKSVSQGISDVVEDLRVSLSFKSVSRAIKQVWGIDKLTCASSLSRELRAHLMLSDNQPDLKEARDWNIECNECKSQRTLDSSIQPDIY
ncbi:hypothetical protein G9A89_001419 [Geosiphon pyriformis]|nr:hypothetical protein G9A89_001419 [Geosiphon pyriformis]